MRPHLSSFFALPIVALLAAGNLARADDFTEPGGINTCELRAWSTDPDPDGLNIRSGPGTEYPVIGNLPAPLEVEGDEFATEMSITGSKDGWIRIGKGEVVDYIFSEDAVVFEGEGWVSGRYVGFDIEGTKLFDEPSHEAAPVADLTGAGPKGEDGGPYNFVIEHVQACDGYWVEIEGRYFDADVRGWMSDICPNQVTTCP